MFWLLHGVNKCRVLSQMTNRACLGEVQYRAKLTPVWLGEASNSKNSPKVLKFRRASFMSRTTVTRLIILAQRTLGKARAYLLAEFINIASRVVCIEGANCNNCKLPCASLMLAPWIFLVELDSQPRIFKAGWRATNLVLGRDTFVRSWTQWLRQKAHSIHRLHV